MGGSQVQGHHELEARLGYVVLVQLSVGSGKRDEDLCAKHPAQALDTEAVTDNIQKKPGVELRLRSRGTESTLGGREEAGFWK